MNKYSLASSSWDNEEYKAMQKVINSGMFSMGKEVSEFESQFSEYFRKRYSIMVNSGSSANLLMIAALFFRQDNPLKHGDEVIVPAVSWSTTYMPLQQYGLKVKFVDIDLETLNFDLKALSSSITNKTRVILAVNLLGNPNDFAQINQIILDKNIILIEDNCEAMGAEFRSKKAGAWGIMGSFSSFFSHHISTMEGGVIITDDEELYHILLSLRAHGWTRSLPKENHVTGKKSNKEFEESYKFVLPGYNVRPLEISGAIGHVQLEKLPLIVENRRKNSMLFKEVMSNYNQFITQKEIGKSSWFGFSIVIKPEIKIKRSLLLQHLENAGIECRPIVAGNFTKNPVINFFNYEIHDKLKNANIIDTNGFFIGNHHYSLKDELDLLYKTLAAFIKKIFS
jgi:CDP-6-deoxy-D-xylo-4-hexulose-3-dehydrase